MRTFSYEANISSTTDNTAPKSNLKKLQIKIGTTDCKRDLGVLVSLDGPCHEQVCSSVSKAYRVLGLIKSSFYLLERLESLDLTERIADEKGDFKIVHVLEKVNWSVKNGILRPDQ